MSFDVIDVDVFSVNCPRDALLIYNSVLGVEEEKRLCGHVERWEWMTSRNNALLQLISDSSVTYGGFILNFKSLQDFVIAGKVFAITLLI